ncbi:hypothetical protein TcWFU_002311 [Taenia crassiceps]|uniref:Uncharacterized protein n=1 Tax=Taenia crassiceps TaxID=6207 RepID=A0ABR4QGB9_9CEST
MIRFDAIGPHLGLVDSSLLVGVLRSSLLSPHLYTYTHISKALRVEFGLSPPPVHLSVDETTAWNMKGLGKYFKNAGTHQKEDTRGSASVGTDKTGNVVKKAEVNSLDEKVRSLEAELKARNAELTERNNTIKCLQEFKAGVGLGSSAADFYHVKDKACRQVIEDTQQLYRELEDFNKLVNSDDKSKYEPPIPPAGTSLNLSSAVGVKEAIVPRHYQRTAREASAGVAASAEGDSKLANIRRNWEEHNLKILDLNGRLKAAYDLIVELSKASSAVTTEDAKGPITTTSVMKTKKAPQKEATPESALWYVPEKGGVSAKQKNMLLSLVGDETDEESAEDGGNPAQPAAALGSTANDSVPTFMGPNFCDKTYDNGEKPEWVNEIGEIEIVPVEAALLYSLAGKSEAKKGLQGSISSTVKDAPIPANTPLSSSKPQETNYATEKIPSQRSLRSNGCDSDVSDDEKMKSNMGINDRRNANYHSQTNTTEASKPVVSSTHQVYMAGGKWSNQASSQLQPRSSAKTLHQQSHSYNSDVD